MDPVEVADGQYAAAFAAAVELAPFRGRGEYRKSGKTVVGNLRRRLPGSFRGDFQLPPVVSELHVRVAQPAQALIGLPMTQVVGDMGEPGALRLQQVDQRQR